MKIVHPDAKRGRQYPLSQREAAARAAIEKQLSKYIHLTCKHYVAIEVAMLYASFPHKDSTYYCENCQQWQEKSKVPAYIIPDEPPY